MWRAPACWLAVIVIGRLAMTAAVYRGFPAPMNLGWTGGIPSPGDTLHDEDAYLNLAQAFAQGTAVRSICGLGSPRSHATRSLEPWAAGCLILYRLGRKTRYVAVNDHGRPSRAPCGFHLLRGDRQQAFEPSVQVLGEDERASPTLHGAQLADLNCFV